ncbi:hypothetical protein FHX48_002071 [Microbacterium halimionae]|uniref:DUF222 domain-containing protein n=1 Tax=Microbacterium halimionae TaxID=1526413 RepID=A0A7W3JQ55_9MICO|nr:HNH endonuclease signature motif containing protein [Microbacterium halimionae]MBA8816977.1 hypothetical protein [Microbacterium halimionae]NII94484.1 hypothetical protein [Microbacterium halimionae]
MSDHHSPHLADAAAAEPAGLTAIYSGVVHARQKVAEWQATEVALLAEAGRIGLAQGARSGSRSSHEREMPLRSIAAELGTVMHVADRTAQGQIDEAMTIVGDYPETYGSWAAGRISRGHVTTVLRTGAPISDAKARAQFDRDVAPIAEVETTGRLRKRAEALAEKAQPRTMAERHGDARESRKVWVTPLPDGMAELHAELPGILAHGIHDRLTQQARAIKDARRDAGAEPVADTEKCTDERTGERVSERDERTTDQIRADLLADMLLTAGPVAGFVPGDGTGEGGTGLGAIRAIVQVTVPATSLCGSDFAPGDAGRMGLVDPETARRLAGNAPGWDRVFTDPVSLNVLAVDRYRPSEQLKRHLRARDQHCRFVGCRTPAHRCDIDHTIDAALGGPTEVRNLAHLCRRHHSLKHATAWRVKQKPGGVLEWISPTGHSYTDRPPGVMFQPTPRDVTLAPDTITNAQDDSALAPF